MIFSEINWAFQKRKRTSEAINVGFTRTKSTLQGRPSDSELNVSNLSVAASAYIHELELKLASAEEEIKTLKAAADDNAEDRLVTLKREKTKVESSLARLDRDAHGNTQKIVELNKQILEQRETILALERELVAHKADSDRLASMERELTAIGGDSSDVSCLMETGDRKGLISIDELMASLYP